MCRSLLTKNKTIFYAAMGRKSHCTSEKRRLVMNLRKDGKSLREIAKSINRSLNFVQNALKLKPAKETRGRPRKTTDCDDRRILAMAKKNPFCSSKVISAEIGNIVSPPTVRRRLQKANLPGRLAKKVPLMRKNNLQMRLQFAESHSNRCGPEGEKKWTNILWSDETKINLFGNDYQKHVRRPNGKEFHIRFTKKTVKHGGGCINVWGCFSWYGVGPIFQTTNKMTALEYRKIMERVMLPYAEENMPLRWVFQQDNDPKHTSKLLKNFFEDNKVPLLTWPSQSPDLNPIENLWGHLKQKLGKQSFTNKQDFVECNPKMLV